MWRNRCQILYYLSSVWWGGRGWGSCLLTLLGCHQKVNNTQHVLHLGRVWWNGCQILSLFPWEKNGEWFQHNPPSVHISQPAHIDGLSGPSKKLSYNKNYWSRKNSEQNVSKTNYFFCSVAKLFRWNSCIMAVRSMPQLWFPAASFSDQVPGIFPLFKHASAVVPCSILQWWSSSWDLPFVQACLRCGSLQHSSVIKFLGPSLCSKHASDVVPCSILQWTSSWDLPFDQVCQLCFSFIYKYHEPTIDIAEFLPRFTKHIAVNNFAKVKNLILS